jgi:hypothetical protein
MFLQLWRLLTILLTALSMSVAVCHLLEMPPKLGYDGATWLGLLQTLYPPMFGTLGGGFETGAMITSLVLVWLVRHRRPAFGWTLLGAVLLLAMHAVFWIWIVPVNATLLPLTPETLPPNWSALRNQWEYAHAARALMQLAALAALVWSVLGETD